VRIAVVTVAGLIQVRKTAAVRSGVQETERITMYMRVQQDVVVILQESSQRVKNAYYLALRGEWNMEYNLFPKEYENEVYDTMYDVIVSEHQNHH